MNNTIKNKEIRYPGIQDGEIFSIAGIKFIKFPSKNGETPIVAKDILFYSSFGENNDFRESKVLTKLQEEFLPKIIAAIGEENLCTIKTDLTTWDGLKPYGVMESLISLPTMDFYRENVKLFDQHKIGRWWWLATPESAQPHCDPDWILCVSPSGNINCDCYCIDHGVRPILILKSSIFESFEV
jgi:hypothetical protein